MVPVVLVVARAVVTLTTAMVVVVGTTMVVVVGTTMVVVVGTTVVVVVAPTVLDVDVVPGVFVVVTTTVVVRPVVVVACVVVVRSTPRQVLVAVAHGDKFVVDWFDAVDVVTPPAIVDAGSPVVWARTGSLEPPAPNTVRANASETPATTPVTRLTARADRSWLCP